MSTERTKDIVDCETKPADKLAQIDDGIPYEQLRLRLCPKHPHRPAARHDQQYDSDAKTGHVTTALAQRAEHLARRNDFHGEVGRIVEVVWDLIVVV